MQVLEKLGSGLGYQTWLRVDRFGACDLLRIDSETVAHCHPTIRAEDSHAREVGCEVGALICGVRWFSPFVGQEVCNPGQQF